jgi:beta-RFAP synthase
LKIKIDAGSRIHLGFIDPLGVSGRRWGSVGLYLNQPKLSVIVEKSYNLIIHGPKWLKDTASRISEKLKINGLKIICEEYIPRHVGLGSGTQTILSIGLAASRLYGLDLTLEEIAEIFNRCRRSGAGYWLFQKGGLTIDGGRTPSTKLPPLLFRCDLPSEWKILLAIPTIEELGLHSKVEEESFNKLNAASLKDASTIILMKLLPSIIEKDFLKFTEAIEELDTLTSSFFRDIQLGAYHPLSREVVELMKNIGVRGVGQSSWGPTVYGFVREDEVEYIAGRLKPVNAFRYVFTEARNHGAQLTEL